MGCPTGSHLRKYVFFWILIILGILIGPIETYFCAKFQLPRFLGSGDPDPQNFRGSARPKATDDIIIHPSSMDDCLIMDNLDIIVKLLIRSIT